MVNHCGQKSCFVNKKLNKISQVTCISALQKLLILSQVPEDIKRFSTSINAQYSIESITTTFAKRSEWVTPKA